MPETEKTLSYLGRGLAAAGVEEAVAVHLQKEENLKDDAVSYTHLTLPTILLV